MTVVPVRAADDVVAIGQCGDEPADSVTGRQAAADRTGQRIARRHRADESGGAVCPRDGAFAVVLQPRRRRRPGRSAVARPQVGARA